MSTEAKQLMELSRKLSAERVREVVDFAEFLLAKSPPRAGNGTAKRGKLSRRYIGGVNHGALASGIDDELYGRSVR